VSSTLRKRYSLEKKKRSVILDKIKDMLDAQGEISFAYVHGSFLDGETFGDIDIAVYLYPLPPRANIYYEFALENAVEEQTGYPVDVRIINEAPLSFKFSVLRNGKCILEKDEDIRVAFQEQTVSMYYDFAPFRERYLKEALEP
jgi:predicted nucleotidyltransferase